MLKRIKNIKNIGTLINAHSASCEFRKFTVIYGCNSQGKSTLCDIFNSLKKQDSTPIEKRKTVNATEQPKVNFTFSGDKEVEISYANGSWSCKDFYANFEIFDTDFVHRNVFTNNETIEHTNKENFTEFVIGDEVVEISQTLAKLNEEKNNIDRLKKTLENKIESSGYKIDELISIKFVEDATEADSLCLALKSSIRELSDNKSKISEIQSLPLPTLLQIDIEKLIDIYKKTNAVLSSNFSFESDDLISAYIKHKKIYLHNLKNPDLWLQSGMECKTSDICPFCGQSIENSELINSYLVIFSDTFKHYNHTIEQLKPINLDVSYYDKLILEIEENLKKINGITKKLLSPELSDLLNIIDNTYNQTKSCILEFKNLHTSINQAINITITKKLADKYLSVAAISLESMEKLQGDLLSLIEFSNSKINEFNAKAKVELSNLSVSSLDSRIKECEIEFKDNERVFYRNKFDSDIIEYQNLIERRKINRQTEKEKKEEFDIKQNEFLETFFQDIENFFSRLGSKNYKIEKEDVSKGIKKTYSLKLKFRDRYIAPQDIKYVLSESDKRALALAIFLSKLKHVKNTNTIIVLDDPISSFDIDRMQAFINILKSFQDDVDQIIILTHYQSFYRQLVSWSSNYMDLSLLKIAVYPETNNFEKVDRENDELLMDEYQKNLFQIVSFIKNKTHSYNAVSARVFMQKFLEYYFMLEIKEKNLNYDSLDQLLKVLLDTALISEEKYKRLDIKREEYNAPAHEFDSSTEEAKRISLIDLYEILHEV